MTNRFEAKCPNCHVDLFTAWEGVPRIILCAVCKKRFVWDGPERAESLEVKDERHT